MRSDIGLNVTYCDDIRQEIGNKFTLVGCYSADLIVDRFPAILPKFCVLVRLLIPVDYKSGSLVFKIKRNADVFGEIVAGSEAFKQQENGNYSDATTGVVTGMLCASPFPIDSPCKITIEAVLDGESIHSLPLRIHTAETAAAAKAEVNRPLAAG